MTHENAVRICALSCEIHEHTVQTYVILCLDHTPQKEKENACCCLTAFRTSQSIELAIHRFRPGASSPNIPNMSRYIAEPGIPQTFTLTRFTLNPGKKGFI